MQIKQGAVELIRKFQQLFADLNHRQIAERLVKQVVAQPGLSRCALVVQRDDSLYVEAIDLPDSTACPSAPLKSLKNLPGNLLQDCFQLGSGVALDLEHAPSLSTLPASNSLVIQMVGDENRPMAAYVCESTESLEQLQEALKPLESLWVFSTLLVHQLVQTRSHEEQAEKFRIAEQALWASETYLNAILYHSPTLISVKDLDGNVVLASDHFMHVDGIDESGYVGKNVFDVYEEELARKLWEADQSALDTHIKVEEEIEIRHKDGNLHTYLMVKFPLKDKHHQTFGVCTICTDISERKEAEDTLREQQSRLNYMAFHDSLTGLPNRALFYDRINHGLARAKRSGNKLALMLLDLDRFKNINDSLGHDAGDLLLKAVSKRLQDNVRDMDTVARLGGDEFVVVLEGIQDEEDIGQVANKLLSGVSKSINISGHDIASTVSIGISMYPEDGEDTDTLLKNADIAMYKAKEAGKNNFKYYTEGMNATAVNYLLLENDLRRAIETDQLMLMYQPQIDLQTGSLLGMEALVRWNHPDRGMVSPVHFIPLAEETGLIVALGDWVLREACKQQRIWLQQGRYSNKVAVNLSPRQFRQENFPQRVAEILNMMELPAKYLELEITESSAMENAGETITMMNELNAMGVSLAIDDFGTGYSSLAYLKRFPIQKLKIDRSFINDIATDQNDAAIARSIISLAHNMSLNVVAEGVEHDVQVDWLRRRGCDMAQGFYYAKPLTVEQMNHHLKEGSFSSSSNVVKLEFQV
jgi:diguanylate cyclase (GGDEF)-like protein/PAS domain S-box-containing protein